MLPENPGHNYLNLDGATESSKPTTPATPASTTSAATTTATVGAVTDESYDFPRSHQPQTTVENNAAVDQSSKHLYSNAAPSTVNDETTTHNVFRYDFHEDEPPSPRSESSTAATYSNLPSPLVRDSSAVPIAMAPPPPMVYRELKPGRKTSDSMSVVSNEPSPGPIVAVCDVSSAEHSPAEPPSINRKLKPSLSKSPVEGRLSSYTFFFLLF